MNTATATTTSSKPASLLRTIRARRGINQERLAALSGFSRGWIGFLERNPECMTSTAAERLAAVLHVLPEDLHLCDPAGSRRSA
jgi:transcriptional regulator with XRE-family HTH domain